MFLKLIHNIVLTNTVARDTTFLVGVKGNNLVINIGLYPVSLEETLALNNFQQMFPSYS